MWDMMDVHINVQQIADIITVYSGGSAGQHRWTSVRAVDAVEAVPGAVRGVPVAGGRLERVQPDTS